MITSDPITAEASGKLSVHLLAGDATDAKKLVSINETLSEIPSYELSSTVISGKMLQHIHLLLKNLTIDLSEVLPVSVSGLYRQFKKEDIDLEIKDNLTGIIYLINKGLLAFEDFEDFKEWLSSRVETLGNRRPCDLLSLQTGRREVEQALDRVEYNVYG